MPDRKKTHIIERHLTLQPHDLAQPFASLANSSGLSQQQIKSAMQKGCVWLTRGKTTQRLRRKSRTLKVSDVIHLYYNPEVLSQMPPAAHLIKDEQDYSVWLKPCGMFAQGSKWSDHCTIVRWAESHLLPQRNAFTVHRIDRATTGLILIAHTKSIARALSHLFETRQISKTYHAWVMGELEQSHQSISTPLAGQSALTHIDVLRFHAEENRSLVRVSIETGRKHQIRQHLAGIGHPIIGDRLYGKENADRLFLDQAAPDLQLYASNLSFQDPRTGQLKHFQLPEGIIPDE